MKSQPYFNTDNNYRRILFPYAYNIIGSVEDAKDAVQDVLLKHLSTQTQLITDERNYLIRSVINTAINIKNRKQRLQQEEVWLLEPIATEDVADKHLYLSQVLSYSLLVLMEKLNARQRAVFILKESFEYSHAQIVAILSITEDHSRKLLSTAKASLYKPTLKRTPLQDAHEQVIVAAFMDAIRQRDIEQLEALLTEDIRFYADAGGKVPLLAKASKGMTHVATLQMKIYHSFLTSAKIVYTLINHQPALLYYVNEKLTACQVFDVHPQTGVILQINAVLDPDKLKSLTQPFS